MTGLHKTVTMLADRCAASRLGGGFSHLMRMLGMLFDPYRPELHYMRGPGPRWHAKHDPAPAFAGAPRSQTA